MLRADHLSLLLRVYRLGCLGVVLDNRGQKLRLLAIVVAISLSPTSALLRRNQSKARLVSVETRWGASIRNEPRARRRTFFRVSNNSAFYAAALVFFMKRHRAYASTATTFVFAMKLCSF
jgi:hypothetical protein